MAMFDKTIISTLGNQASGTLAVANVDAVNTVAFTQTTASVTMLLPNPTVATAHKAIVLRNLPGSTQILHVGGSASGSDIVSLAVGDIREMAWNGASWRSTTPRRSLVLTSGTLSGLLGGVTWTVTASDPITLTTSIGMTGMVRCRLQQWNGSQSFNYWMDGSSGASSLLNRGKVWSTATTGSVGIFSATYSCTISGILTGNGRTFRLSGGSNGTSGMAIIIDVLD